MTVHKYVILDKNFLQAEDNSVPRLRALAHCGCDFVLTDTLIYELCSDRRRTTLWLSIQKKLASFADRLHLWFHAAELLRREVARKSPIALPGDTDATESLRVWFRSRCEYVPSDIEAIIANVREQREVNTMKRVAPMARAVGEMLMGQLKQVGDMRPTTDDLVRVIRDGLDSGLLVRWIVGASHGNPDSVETFFPKAAESIDASWFMFHHARATLALIGIFLRKYGFVQNPGQKFVNTKLDIDYLVLLQYAEALASDETADMAVLAEWLYARKKKLVRSDRLLAMIPREDEIRRNAYSHWVDAGRTNGHQLADWLNAEEQMYERVWNSL